MLKLASCLTVCGLTLSGCAGGSGRSAGLSHAPVLVKYGKLQVIGTHLCDGSGRPVQLRGMSTMGLQWMGEVVNDAAFAALAKDWKADVVRLAMYVGEGGYAVHPEIKETVWKGVDLAVKHGLYVIVDWHVLSPGNPNHDVYKGAQAFFDEASRRFAHLPNVMYEIMNEPNGDISWAQELKPYAEKMVATIRTNDPDNIILIGSGTWSQDVDEAAGNPVQGKNLMYTFHFYPGSHRQGLRDKVQTAIDRGAAVFCSEWGTTDYSGTGPLYLDEAEKWLAFLDQRQISWTNWSLCDKHEGSAALISPGDALRSGKKELIDRETLMVPEIMGPDGYPIWTPDELSPSGKFVREKIRAGAAGNSAKN